MNVRNGAAIGLVVTGLLVVVMLLLRLLADVPTLPELALDWLTLLVPVGLFGAVLDTLGPAAKPLTFSLLFIAMFAAGAIVGGALGGLLGRRSPETPDRPVFSSRRRIVLERVAWGGLALAGLGGAWRYLTSPHAAKSMGATAGSQHTRRASGSLADEVTTNADFYRVSKNLANPHADPQTWRLQVIGLVREPISLKYEEVTALPIVHQWQTLECVSNEVGGDYIGNAVWSGFKVSDLIARAGGADPRATRAIFYGQDNYSDGFPLAKTMEPTTLLAAYMNSETLPPEHGFPLRLLVPGVYGMKNVKWVNAIELVDHTSRGYWEQRGWSEAAVVKTTARIDVPKRGDVARSTAARIAGIAFAGDRGIAKVEVSDDDGGTWREATLHPPKGPFSWVLWEIPWTPQPGAHRLLARATDGRGAVQGASTSPTLPDGASGYHQVDVRVV